MPELLTPSIHPLCLALKGKLDQLCAETKGIWDYHVRIQSSSLIEVFVVPSLSYDGSSFQQALRSLTPEGLSLSLYELTQLNSPPSPEGLWEVLSLNLQSEERRLQTALGLSELRIEKKRHFPPPPRCHPFQWGEKPEFFDPIDQALPSLSPQSKEKALLSSHPPVKAPFRDLFSCLEDKKDSPKGITFLTQDLPPRFCSYGDLYDQALRLASQLQEQGVGVGEVILLAFEDRLLLLQHFFAALSQGACPVPFFAAKEEETHALLEVWEELGQPFVYTDHPQATKLAFASSLKALKDPKTLPPAAKRPLKEGSRAFMLFTSGSTGKPKGVIYDHSQILANLMGSIEMTGIRGKDRTLNFMELTHAGALIRGCLRDILVGNDQIQLSQSYLLKDPAVFFEVIEQYRVTFAWTPNFGFSLFLSVLDSPHRVFNLSSLRSLLSSAEPIDPRLAQAFVKKAKRHQMNPGILAAAWGMSETAAAVVFKDDFPHHPSPLPGHVRLGEPAPGCQIKIVSQTGKLARWGELGEIYVRGPQLASGYWQSGQPVPLPKTAGWFASGDLGVIVDGELVVCGRKKDMVIVYGQNVFLKELESLLKDHPALDYHHFALFQVADPKPRLVAVICFKDKALDENPLEQKKVLQKLRKILIQAKNIHLDYLIPLKKSDFPQTSPDCPLAQKLKERFLAGAFDPIIIQTEWLVSGPATCELFLAKRSSCPKPLSTDGRLPTGPLVVWSRGTRLEKDFLAWLGESNQPFSLIASSEPRIPTTELPKAPSLTLVDFYSDSLPSPRDHLPVLAELEAFLLSGGGVYYLGVFQSSFETGKAIASYCQCLTQNHPEFGYKTLFLGEATTAQTVGQELKERKPFENEVFYEGTKRFCQILEPVFLPFHPPPPKPLGGTYLLIGGLGDIGYDLALELLQKEQATLFLLGRRKKSELEEDSLQRLKTLKSNSPAVSYHRLPASPEKWLKKQNIQNLTGIYHLARHRRLEGEAGIALECEAKLAPLPFIEGLLAAFPRAYCVATSAVATVTGGAHLGAYAIANRLLEERMAQLADQGYLTFTLILSSYQPPHPLKEESLRQWAKATGEVSLSPGKALALLRHLPSFAEKSLICGLDLTRPKLLCQSSYPPLPAYHFRGKGQGPVEMPREMVLNPSSDKPLRIKLRSLSREAEEFEKEVRRRLKKLWSQILLTRPIRDQDHFFFKGGSSLEAIQAIAQIRDIWPTLVTVEDLYQTPRLKPFARLIIKKLRSERKDPLFLLREQIRSNHTKVRRLFPPQEFAEAMTVFERELQMTQKLRSYRELKQSIQRFCETVPEKKAVLLIEHVFHHMLLEAFSTLKQKPHRNPFDIHRLHWLSDLIEIRLGGQIEPLELSSEEFIKDLAVLSHRLLPLGGAWVMEEVRVPRRWFLGSLLKKGAFRPFLGALVGVWKSDRYLRLHVSRRYLHRFHEAARHEAYLRMGDYLREHPEVVGCFGVSWYFNPGYLRERPELGYLLKPLDFGALVLAVPSGIWEESELGQGGEEGGAFMLFWPREGVLEYAGSTNSL